MRGLRGIFLDMYRNPDKLLAAIDHVTPMMIGMAIAQCEMTGCPGVFIPLHKGSDGFLSLDQFEKFYWPSLKKMILALIDHGLTPCPFFEGIHTKRLDYYADLPKGKVLGFFDSTDIYQAKEKLGGKMCMSGFMPLSLLQTGNAGKGQGVRQGTDRRFGQGRRLHHGPQKRHGRSQTGIGQGLVRVHQGIRYL